MRCRGWRFKGAEDVSLILPIGRNHKVWSPCISKVSQRGAICDECVTSLLLCPSVEVRRALVEHKFLSDRFLRDLTSDPDYATSQRANERLREREGVWS